MPLVIIILSILGVLGFILFLPIRGAGSFKYDVPAGRIHEADVVLSRRLLTPGSREYEVYYQLHPALKDADDRARLAPGLLSEKSRYYHPGTFAAANANFELVDILNAHTLSEPSGRKVPVHPDKLSGFLTRWLKQTGAHSVGFTRLEDYHLYSHKGRGPRAGEPVTRNHPHAIAITVEMDHRMLQSAPAGSTVMESSEQYLRSGVLAMKVASYIRKLGYGATAHIDGNYEVICPLVAADAGLGVIGRMGLLMTPKIGPRVRISVVTTDIPLSYTRSNPDPTTLHFCHHCKKCASVCPTAAIPEGPRKVVGGIKRWQINSENCYLFWTLSGTDCGRCMGACPYSHPDDWFHRFIRWGIKNNLVFRHMAIKLDNIFYGRRPPIRPLPNWTNLLDKA